MITRLIQTTLLFVLMLCFAFADVQYDQVRVWSGNTRATLTELAGLGLDLESANVRRDVYVDVVVNEYERQQLLNQGLEVEELISDLATYYAQRLNQGAVREFGYGSMGGYYTFAEVIASMDSLHEQYPDLVSAKDSIGSSYEGRTIWAFKISDNPEVDEAEPEVFYNSLIHAREPEAMMTLLYFAWELAENHDIDPLMTYLVDEREMWFVPVVNPDGYVYNETTHPNGGGLHRKNRRPGCTSVPGVDLNRNWGFQWGYDDNGSSPDQCSETYRGTSAFSEPETQTIRDFVQAHDFQAVFNYHTYGNLLIRPFGYDPNASLNGNDEAIYTELGQDLVAQNHYLFGTGDQTVGYAVNGDAVDYMYGGLGIINFTPEVGSWAEGGFWPPTDKIYEMAAENIPMNIHLAGIAGSWIRLQNFELLSDSALEDQDVLAGTLLVRNKGLHSEPGTVTLHLNSPDSSIIPSQDTFDLSELPPQLSTDLGASDLSFTVNTAAGTLAHLVIDITNAGYYTVADTFVWRVGVPDTIYYDDFEMGMTGWSSTSWGITGDAYGGDNALTDSPFGDYPALSELDATLTEAIDLRGYTAPVITFDAKWDIENDYDFCQILASFDDGSTWRALTGAYTVIGNGATVQPPGEPGYDGFQDWIHETLDLPADTAANVLLKFKLMSDTYYEGDGFVVDNLAVLGWGIGFHAGDITRDGLVNINDAVLLLDWIVAEQTLTGDLLELADINQDSSVDILDLVQLIEGILANTY